MNLEIKKTFGKSEKLCSSKSITDLFEKGNSFIAYPLRVVFIVKEVDEYNQPGISMLVSVSKRKFKRAVKRNRVKRLVREAYRLNKECFLPIVENKNHHLDIAFIYLDTEIYPYADFDKSMKKTARLLVDKLLPKE